MTAVGAVNNWDCCDEAVTDDDATYVRLTVDGVTHLDLYNIADTGLPVDAVIVAMKLYFRCKSLDVDYPASFRGVYVTSAGGVHKVSGWANPALAYETFEYSIPVGDFPAAIVDLNDWQIGVEGVATFDEEWGIWRGGRCTQVYLVIYYTIAGGVSEISKVKIGGRCL